MNDNYELAFCVVLGLTIGILIGFLFGITIEYGALQQEAVKHGAAHYDTVTGEWQWNDPPKVVEEVR